MITGNNFAQMKEPTNVIFENVTSAEDLPIEMDGYISKTPFTVTLIVLTLLI